LAGDRWELSNLDSITFQAKGIGRAQFFLGWGKSNPIMLSWTLDLQNQWKSYNISKEDIEQLALENDMTLMEIIEQCTGLGFHFSGAGYTELWLDEILLNGLSLRELFPN
jgi:hypothetical protein